MVVRDEDNLLECSGFRHAPDMDYLGWGSQAAAAAEFVQDDEEPDPEEEDGDDGDGQYDEEDFDRDDESPSPSPSSSDGDSDSNEEDVEAVEEAVQDGDGGEEEDEEPVPEYPDGHDIDMSDIEDLDVIEKNRVRNVRILFKECFTDYTNKLYGIVEEDPEGGSAPTAEREGDDCFGDEADSDSDEDEEDDEDSGEDDDSELVNGPVEQPTPPQLDWLLNPLRQAPEEVTQTPSNPGTDPDPDGDPDDPDDPASSGFGFGEVDPAEFDPEVDLSLPIEDQLKELMTETRTLKINNYLLKEVISYHLRLIDLHSNQLEQRDERNRTVELELKEVKAKLNGVQDEVLAMKSNQNLIGRHEQATQTTSLVYPITITPTPRPPPPAKVKPTGNSNNNNSINNGASTSGSGGSRPHSAGGGGGGRGVGSGAGSFKKFPKLPEPNNITHRIPPKYQYGHAHTRIPFGSSASPVKKSPSPPKEGSDHENDGDDDDDDDDEPQFHAVRQHASNHHTNTYSKKSRPSPKMISAHRRSSSSTDSSASESRSSKHAQEQPRRRPSGPSPPNSGRTTPTRSKGHSSFGRQQRRTSPTGPQRSSPVRLSSPVENDHRNTSPGRENAYTRGSSPSKLRSPSPPRQVSSPARQPSPPARQPSPPRLRRAGKDKLYFMPARSPSSSKLLKNKKPGPSPATPGPSPKNAQTPTSSQNSTHVENSASSSPRTETRLKSKSPSPTRPKSIPISRDSPNLFSANSSASSSPSNSLSRATDDETYEDLFAGFKKFRPTPIMVTSVAEARLGANDGSLRKAVMIKSNPLATAGLKKDDFLKHAKTACVRLDRTIDPNAMKSTTSSKAHAKSKSPPPPPMRTIDYDWRIPSRPIPFINDGQKAGSSKMGSSNLVKTALRRKRNSPQSKEEIAKKIRMLRFSKTGMKGKEKDLREYIAQKYQVKKDVMNKPKPPPVEEEEEEELYDIDEYIEPAESKPIKFFMRTPPPAVPRITELLPPAVVASVPSVNIGPKPSAAPSSSKSVTISTSAAAAATTKKPGKIIKKTKLAKPSSTPASLPPKRRLSTRSDSSRTSPILSRALTTRQSRSSTEGNDQSLTPAPAPAQPQSSKSPPSLAVKKKGKRKAGQLTWPPRAFTNRHDQTLMTDDPFYAMGSTGMPIGSSEEDQDDEDQDSDCQIIAVFEDEPDVDPNLRDEDGEKVESEVLVPSWRIVKYAPMKSRQLDEDLDDSAYEKRHTKWEIDERRRKRWDAQIQREEEYTRYLRERQVQKDQRALKRYNRATGGAGMMEHDDTMTTLLPDGKQARYILVADNLPVISFGYALPNIEREGPFKKPWKDRNEEDVPEEEEDIILPVITRAKSRAAARRGLPAPVGRKPSSGSRGQSPGPGESGLLAIEGPSGSTDGGKGKDTRSRVQTTHPVRAPHLRQDDSDDMEVD